MKSTDYSLTDYQLQDWLPSVCQIAYEAGQLLSTLYHQSGEVDVQQKQDGTPVTEADEKADALIRQRLQALTPDMPIVTEESVGKVSFDERQHWQTFWLVDPMDGTKEFIERTGEFSVNIALIHQHQPVLGVVYGPECHSLYFAALGSSAFKCNTIEKEVFADYATLVASASPINVAPLNESAAIRVAVSRRHGLRMQLFMQQLGETELVKMGSALKICLVAEGEADVYPRLGPTSLWDTAAAHCVLAQAGGAIVNAAGHSLKYVQTPSLLNPYFIAMGQADYDWPAIPELL